MMKSELVRLKNGMLLPAERAVLAGFHARMMGDYYEAWFSGDIHTEGAERDKDAFHLLKHASMLGQVTGDPSVKDLLFEEDAEQRHALVRAAARAADSDAWAEALPPVEEDDSALAFVEEALLFRDSLERVWDTTQELAWDAPPEIHKELRSMYARLLQLDKKLQQTEPMLLLHAMRVFDGVRAFLREGEESPWWLESPDERIEKLMDDAHCFVADVVRSAVRSGPATDPLQNAARTLQNACSLLREWLTKAFEPAPDFSEAALVLAEAKGGEDEVFVLSGHPDITGRMTARRDGIKISLETKGKSPASCRGGRLVILDAEQNVLKSLTLTRFARVLVPRTIADTIEKGEALVVQDADGKTLGSLLPKTERGT